MQKDNLQIPSGVFEWEQVPLFYIIQFCFFTIWQLQCKFELWSQESLTFTHFFWGSFPANRGLWKETSVSWEEGPNFCDSFFSFYIKSTGKIWSHKILPKTYPPPSILHRASHLIFSTTFSQNLTFQSKINIRGNIVTTIWISILLLFMLQISLRVIHLLIKICFYFSFDLFFFNLSTWLTTAHN